MKLKLKINLKKLYIKKIKKYKIYKDYIEINFRKLKIKEDNKHY
jgi:hypothetical protein